MQRSRKVLLQRRAALDDTVSVRKRLYKVSLSVVLISWGIFFLLSSLISRAKSYGDADGVQTMICSEATTHEAESIQMPGPGICSETTTNECLFETKLNDHDQSTHIQMVETDDNSNNLLVSVENEKPRVSDDKEHASETTETELKTEKKIPPKSDRSSRVAPPNLDDFKNKALAAKEKPVAGQAGSVIHRVEPGRKEYNYASASRGAKVLAFNKEAKGASNVLDKDKDKYLRNPCSAEDKHVVIELSEETLVDTIEIANFEHYSSNLKDFELWSSLVYPTDSWVKIGNFTAANVKHAQRFVLQEAKWARYLKLNLLSHYGSEFYCTLSSMEVYGEDAVERMLEDLISVQDSRFASEEPIPEKPSSVEPVNEDDIYRELLTNIYPDPVKESINTKLEVPKSNGVDSVVDSRPPQVGRMPGDTVLKILMQKVHLLDLNSAVLERYLEELNSRYGQIFKDIDSEIADKDLVLEQIRLEIKNLQMSNDAFVKDMEDLLSWKSTISSQLDRLVQYNAALRSEVETVRDNQANMENRGLAVIFISFIFGCFAAIKLVVDLLVSFCRMHKAESFCRSSSGWIILLLSSTIVAFILVI